MTKTYDVAIIGGGASGMSAALYIKRSGLNPVIIERGLFGGQINNTSTIENYLGVGNISGEDLSDKMFEQIRENNIDIVYTNIESVGFKADKTAILQSRNDTIFAKSIILATGVKHKELGVPGEKENQGKGISYCAICDGYFFKDKDILVVGGGDSAFEEGAYLADIAKSVTLVYYNDESRLKAKSSLVKNFYSKDNTRAIFNYDIKSFSRLSSDNESSTIAVRPHGDLRRIAVDGVFVYVGVEPINDLAKQIGVELDSNGYIKVGSCYQTSTSGVFAIGDIIHPEMKQVAIAVSDGALVSKYVKEYLG